MASHMMVWAAIGKPNQREWVAQGRGPGFDKNDGLYPSGYYLFDAQPAESLRAAVQENEKERLAPTPQEKPQPRKERRGFGPYHDRLWKGWILPASDADTWFVAGSAAYLQMLETEDLDKALTARRAIYRGLKLAPDDPIRRFRLEETKGVLFLDALRRKLGDDHFFPLMTDFFAANTTRTVTAQSFLEKAGVPFDFSEPGGGPAYLLSDIYRRLPSAVIVYGTLRDAGANRYAAEQLQRRYLDQYESQVPIYKDFEVSDDVLRSRDVVFVGRPEANSALAAWSDALSLEYSGASFRIANKAHADEREALLLAGTNPRDPSHMALVIAGNDALRTVKAASARLAPGEYAIYEPGKQLRAQFR
jgi:hypothetical protein